MQSSIYTHQGSRKLFFLVREHTIQKNNSVIVFKETDDNGRTTGKVYDNFSTIVRWNFSKRSTRVQ